MNAPMAAPAATSPATVYAAAAGLRTARANPFGSITHSHGRAATNWTAARMMPAARTLRDMRRARGLRVGVYAEFYAAAGAGVRSGRRDADGVRPGGGSDQWRGWDG